MQHTISSGEKKTNRRVSRLFCLRSNSTEPEEEKYFTNTSYQMPMMYFLIKIHQPINISTLYLPLSHGYQSRNSGGRRGNFNADLHFS